MAFSATEWRNLIANYSGSQAGTRSWGVLGNSQAQGKFYVATYKDYAGYGSSYKMRAKVEGCAGGYQPKNVTSFYSVRVGIIQFSTFYNAYTFPSFTTNYTANNVTIYSTPAGVYTLGTIGTYTDTLYTAPAIGSQTYFQVVGNKALNGSFYVAFYNFSPWGTGPFSAGSNVAIGRGPAGSPSSGYPYQRFYDNSGVNYCP